MADVIKTTFQLKRGLATDFKKYNITLNAGEPGWTIDTHILKIGDGVTPWNLLKPVNEGKVTEEQIQEAVNNYFKENPIINNEYFAGNGLQVINNEFSIKLAEDSEDFLSVDKDGIKLTGISNQLNNKISKKTNSEEIAQHIPVFTSEGDIDASELQIQDIVDQYALSQKLKSFEQTIDSTTDKKIQEAGQNYATKKELKSTDDLAKATDAKLTAFLGSVTDLDATQGVIDTLEEIQKYMTDDTAAFTQLSEKVDANEAGIGAIEVYLSDELLPYLEGIVADVDEKTFAVDNKTIKLTEKTEEGPVAKAYVAEVSTDILVQGTQTLVFCAGTASTVI